jgi:hypothetical protein
MFSVTVPVSAATSILAGEVFGTWDLAGSPYLVEGDIAVPFGEALTIEPGVEVLFQGWYKLTVNGVLDAVGTELGIRFVNAPDSSRLTQAIVERGQVTGASPEDRGGGIYVENSNPIISNSTIQSYQWQQLSGPAVSLRDANTAVASFRSPSLRKSSNLTLAFELTVIDNEGAIGSDLVTIVVNNWLQGQF